MARKVFFSFHYERDAWRAAQVRNSNQIGDEDKYGFVDAVDWERIQRQGSDAVKRWIQAQLSNTSVTVVLIGAETATRPWVLYEIKESWTRGNGLLGVYIHNIRDEGRRVDAPGEDPFAKVRLQNGRPLSEYCYTYDWITNNGRENLGSWIEAAATARAR